MKKGKSRKDRIQESGVGEKRLLLRSARASNTARVARALLSASQCLCGNGLAAWREKLSVTSVCFCEYSVYSAVSPSPCPSPPKGARESLRLGVSVAAPSLKLQHNYMEHRTPNIEHRMEEAGLPRGCWNAPPLPGPLPHFMAERGKSLGRGVTRPYQKSEASVKSVVKPSASRCLCGNGLAAWREDVSVTSVCFCEYSVYSPSPCPSPPKRARESLRLGVSVATCISQLSVPVP